MNSFPPIAFAVLFAAGSVASAQSPKPKANLVVAPCDIGERRQFEVVSCDIELKNTGDVPIRISDGQAAAKADTIEADVNIPAHSTAYVKAHVALLDALGDTRHSFRFKTDEPGAFSQRGSSVHAFVTTILDEPLSTVRFDAVAESELPKLKDVAVVSREVGDFRVTGLISKPDYVDATINKDGRGVSIALLKSAPWGLLNETVKFRANSPKQPEVWIRLSANVQGDIVADSNPLSLGLMRTNEKNEFLVRITSRSGKVFKIGKLTLDKIKGTAVDTSCTPASDGCRLVRLRIAGDQGQGRVGGILLVDLPDLKRSLPIRLDGLLLSPEVKVHDVAEEIEKNQSANGSAKSSILAGTTQTVDVNKALKQTIDVANQVLPPGNGPLMRWSVANEDPIYGYIIYRSDAESGPFLRVNDETIRVAENAADKTGSYQWRDNSAESGKTYWYQIGILNRDGSKKELTGKQKIVAK